MQHNQQKPEVKPKGDSPLLDVVDVWRTIQGEGPYAGMPAIFIRLAGCNLQCPLCDTDYTSKRRMMSPKAITELALSLTDNVVQLVVITGGEPFRQDLLHLLAGLSSEFKYVQIESNGTLDPDFYMPWENVVVVCSPKTPKINEWFNQSSAVVAFKYVVEAGHQDSVDGLPTRVLGYDRPAAKPPHYFRGRVYVQPMDEQDEAKNKLHLEAALHACQVHGYSICLQLHKLLGMP